MYAYIISCSMPTSILYEICIFLYCVYLGVSKLFKGGQIVRGKKKKTLAL